MEEEKRLRQAPAVSPNSREKPSSPKPTLENARVLRLAETLNLSVDSLEALKSKLFGAQGREISAIEAKSVPHGYPLVETIDEAEVARLKKAFAPVAQEAKAPAAEPPRKEDSLEDEILLRKKIEASPHFPDFKADAWKLYEKHPRAAVAGRLLELALMYGSAQDLDETLKALSVRPIEFFEQLAPQSRTQIVLKLWLGQRKTLMDTFYFRKDLLLRLLPIERWYIAWSLVEQNRHDQLYRFWQQNEHDIARMQKQFGAQVGKSDSALNYALGSAAFRMNDEEAALKLLECVPKNAPEFNAAIDLLLDVRVERDERGYSTYELRLTRELDWKARLSLLDSFLIRMQRVEHAAPKDRAALNALLKDPLRWFPDTPETINSVAELLLQYSGLDRLLPNILNLFQANALNYLKPSVEHALWSPVLDHDFREPVRTLYWRSIATLHDFAMHLGEDEGKLWQARALYEEAEAYVGAGKVLPLRWQELHEGLGRWIAKTERLDEPKRKALLMMVRLVAEPKDITEADISQYLSQVAEPNLGVIERIETLVRERKQSKLEAFVQMRKAEQLHHTNQSLARLFELAVGEARSDQAWRVLSALHVRQVLGPELTKFWSISGEKRKELPFLDLSERELRIITSGFEGNARKLVEAVAAVGPLIPELLASLNPHLVPQKRTKATTRTETEVSEHLDGMTWITQPKKHFSSGPGGLWQTRPPFFASLADGRWAVLFVGLSQRLGLNAWDWQLSLLNQHIERLIPKMTRSSDSVQVGKVGRWLRGLTPAQRKAWYDLAQVSKKIEDEKAQEILGRFLAILTTTIYQDHIGALATLDKVRAPLRLRWDLENWIVSESYGDVRKGLSSLNVAKLPAEVYRMAVLSPVPPSMKPKA